LDPATSSKVIIEGIEVTFKNAKFITETQITIIVDKVQYYYNRTKKDDKKGRCLFFEMFLSLIACLLL